MLDVLKKWKKPTPTGTLLPSSLCFFACLCAAKKLHFSEISSINGMLGQGDLKGFHKIYRCCHCLDRIIDGRGGEWRIN